MAGRSQEPAQGWWLLLGAGQCHAYLRGWRGGCLFVGTGVPHGRADRRGRGALRRIARRTRARLAYPGWPDCAHGLACGAAHTGLPPASRRFTPNAAHRLVIQRAFRRTGRLGPGVAMGIAEQASRGSGGDRGGVGRVGNLLCPMAGVTQCAHPHARSGRYGSAGGGR